MKGQCYLRLCTSRNPIGFSSFRLHCSLIVSDDVFTLNAYQEIVSEFFEINYRTNELWLMSTGELFQITYTLRESVTL